MQRQPLSSLPLWLGIAKCSCNGNALPLPPNWGKPELGVQICRSRIYPTWMGEGWGEGLRSIVVQRPLTRFAAQTDLSPLGRGELNPPAPAKFQDTCSSSSNNR